MYLKEHFYYEENIDMSSYISIGFVTDNNYNSIINMSKKIFELDKERVSTMLLKYPENETYNNWKTEKMGIADLDKALGKCYSHEMAEIQITIQTDQQNISDIIAKIKLRNSCGGILFEMPESNFDLMRDIDGLECVILNWIKNCSSAGFKYAFCDNEADIEDYKVECVINEEIYSILVINKEQLVTKFSSWKIDGLTRR